MSDLPAGWYDDGSGTQRWWDGSQWTEHVASGEFLGRYRLIATLGEGSFGTVYEAIDPAGVRVAVKAFRSVNIESRASLMAEAQALAAVRSPQCLQVIDVLDGHGRLALVTEFVPGATLRDVMDAQGALTGPQALTVLWDAAQGLNAVHSAGLVHGDVKPANILVSPDGSSRLIDFGLVGLPGVSPDGSASGSPAYAAPEQMLGGIRDARSDIYALSVTLFEVLCGRRPYVADSVLELIHAHAQAPVPDPRTFVPQIGPALAALVMDGLAKDPGQRPQDVATFLARFAEAAQESFGAAWFAAAAVGSVLGGAGLGALASGASGAVAAPAVSGGLSAVGGAVASHIAHGVVHEGRRWGVGSAIKSSTVATKIGIGVSAAAVVAGGTAAVVIVQNHQDHTARPVLVSLANCAKFVFASVPGSPHGASKMSSVSDLIGNMAIDRQGNAYVDSMNGDILKVTPAGAVSTFAGLGSNSANSAQPIPGPATSSPVGMVSGIATDLQGDVYIAVDETSAGNLSGNQILKVTPSGTLSIFAGSGTFGSPTPGPATQSPLGPGPLAVDSQGNVYVGQSNVNTGGQVAKITPSGDLSIVAGNGVIDAPPIAGPATESPLFASALSVDQSGNLYIVDAPNSSVSPNYLVKVTPDGGLSVLAGNGQSGEPVAGSALASPLGAGSISPDQVTVDGRGNVYLAQPNPSSNAEPNLSGFIVRVTPTGQLSVLASNATAQKATGMGSRGTPSQLNPSGLAMNPAGLMYVADTAGYLYRVGCG